jgi:hypothetical protein
VSINKVLSELVAEGFDDFKIFQITGVSREQLEDIRKTAEEFKQLLATAEARAPNEALDDSYELLEKNTLKSLQTQAAFAEPAVQLKILEMAHKRKIQLAPPPPQQEKILIVPLMLPGHAIPQQATQVQYNSENEIIAIGERNFAPLPSSGVRTLFKRIGEIKEAQKNIINADEI